MSAHKEVTRQDALEALKNAVRHDYSVHAQHGIWEFITPSDSAPEIAVLCRKMGQDIQTHIQEALGALAAQASLDDLLDTGLIPNYAPPESGHEAVKAVYDAHILLRTIDREAIANKILLEAGAFAVPLEERGTLLMGMKGYSARVVRNFYTDLQAAADRLAADPENTKPARKGFPALLTAFARHMFGSNNDAIPSAVLPRLWPPLSLDERAATPAVQNDTARSYSDGWFDTLQLLFSELQAHHFESVRTHAYGRLMGTAGLAPDNLENLALNLFDQGRGGIRNLLHTPPKQKCHGLSYTEGAQAALNTAKNIFADIDIAAQARGDNEKQAGGAWLVNHWQVQAERIVARNKTQQTAQPSPSARTI